MKEIIIKVDDKQYTRIMSAAAKRRTTPWTLAKHMLLQVADNDEIEAVTGKRADTRTECRQHHEIGNR